MFKGIVLHWTAGNYYPCEYDKEHYHYLIDKDGKIYKGKYSPEDNLNCKDGKYAAHAGGYNTGRIGISICCRKDLKTLPTKAQIEVMCKLASELCLKYNIPSENVVTHAELSLNRKIDINEIPCFEIKGIRNCGKFFRTRVKNLIELGHYG